MRYRMRAVATLLPFLSLCLLAGPAAAGLGVGNGSPRAGEPIEVIVTRSDDSPAAGVTVTAVYRPGSEAHCPPQPCTPSPVQA